MSKSSFRDELAETCIQPDHPFYNIIQDAYQVFGDVSPKDHCGCAHCMDPEIYRDFFKYGQRDLPLHFLQDWFGAAVSDPLDKDVWIYLLPRVLEALALDQELIVCGVEIVLNRFPTGVKENWNEEQWAVLDRFQKMFLADNANKVEYCLDDVLCMFALAGWPLEELLDQVLELPDAALVQILYRDWCTNGHVSGIWITAFWEKDQAQQMEAFYRSNDLLERILAFGVADDTPEKLSRMVLSIADAMY